MSDAIREVQEATIKPYVSMSIGGQYNVLDKDGKVAYSTRDKTLAYDYFKKNFDKLKEEGDHEVSMAIGQLKTISQYAEKMQTILQSKGNDYDIEAWVQSKITSAEDYMNSVAHYMENDPSVNEEVNEVSDKLKLAVLKKKIKQYKDKVFKKTMSTIKSPLFAGDEIEEGRMKDIFTADQEGKSAEEIAKLMKLPLKTVKSILGEEVYQDIAEFTSDMIKRLQKSYSTMPKTISPEQAKALSKHLDRLDLASLKQLTKAKIPFVTTLARNKVYKKTGKFEEIEEQSSSEIMNKAKEFGVTAKMTSQGIDISGFKTQAGMDKFMKYVASQGKNMINLAKMGMKRNFEVKEEVEYPHKMYDPKSGKEVEAKTPEDHEKYAKMGYTHDKPKEEVKDTEKKESENKDNTIASLKDQIQMLKTKLENEKNKAVKPEPNPDTGEVPLTVGVAYKHFKDKKEKEEVKKEVNEATVVSDISGISIPALKRETAKFNIKVARVTPGGPNGAEYEVTFTGAEKDLVAYAKEHFGFDDKPGSFQQLKKHLNMDYVPEKAMSDKEKRIQRAKDMIKYYDAQKKAALKGKNKDLAKKMLKNDIEESTKPTEFKVKMKTSSGMKTVNVTVPVKNFKVDMAAIEDAARKKVKGDMIDFDFKGDMKEADLTKSQIKQVHKVADDLPKKDFKDRYGKEKGDAVRFGTATNMVKKKLGMKENTSAFNPTVHNKTLGVTSKDLDRAFKKLSNQAQSYVNELLRTGMGTRDAIKKAKQKFNEDNINEDRRLYVETIAGLKKKAEKSGMPYSILKKVYDRGMAAWKSGHRPGASQQQWAFARVNSFVTKSSGTWGGADKDLAKQVRGK
jgi:hypothetical protein